MVALPFTLVRLTFIRKQTETGEQGLITDRLNKSVEGLGVEKQISRLGRDISYLFKGG